MGLYSNIIILSLYAILLMLFLILVPFANTALNTMATNGTGNLTGPQITALVTFYGYLLITLQGAFVIVGAGLVFFIFIRPLFRDPDDIPYGR